MLFRACVENQCLFERQYRFLVGQQLDVMKHGEENIYIILIMQCKVASST